MKKRIIILIIILAIIFCFVLLWMFNSKKADTQITWCSSVNGENFVEAENLRITAKGFFKDTISDEEFSYMQIDEDTKQNINRVITEKGYYTLVEMTRLDGKEMVEPNIQYFVYDNNKNIIASSLYYMKGAKTNSLLKEIIKRQYNSSKSPNDIIKEHIIDAMGWTLAPVWSNENSVMFIIIARDSMESQESKLDLSKINVLIVNPTYKDVETKEKIELENFIFENTIEIDK